MGPSYSSGRMPMPTSQIVGRELGSDTSHDSITFNLPSGIARETNNARRSEVIGIPSGTRIGDEQETSEKSVLEALMEALGQASSMIDATELPVPSTSSLSNTPHAEICLLPSTISDDDCMKDEMDLQHESLGIDLPLLYAPEDGTGTKACNVSLIRRMCGKCPDDLLFRTHPLMLEAYVEETDKLIEWRDSLQRPRSDNEYRLLDMYAHWLSKHLQAQGASDQSNPSIDGSVPTFYMYPEDCKTHIRTFFNDKIDTDIQESYLTLLLREYPNPQPYLDLGTFRDLYKQMDLDRSTLLAVMEQILGLVLSGDKTVMDQLIDSYGDMDARVSIMPYPSTEDQDVTKRSAGIVSTAKGLSVERSLPSFHVFYWSYKIWREIRAAHLDLDRVCVGRAQKWTRRRRWSCAMYGTIRKLEDQIRHRESAVTDATCTIDGS